MRPSAQGLGWLAGSAGRFAIVGVLCGAINVAMIFVGHDLFGLHYLLPAVATCFVTIPLAYLLHSGFSFRTGRAPQLIEFVRFFTAQIGQFLLGLAVMAMFVESLALPATVAMVCASLLLYLLSFVVNSTWVFRVLRLRNGVPTNRVDPALVEPDGIARNDGNRR